MFRGYDYVIVPLGTLTHQQTTRLRALYGPYLARNATLAGRSDNWMLLRHMPGP